MTLTKRQNEVLGQIKDAWIFGEGVKISKKNALTISNLKNKGLVEIYPAHYPMKGFYQSWEAFPCEGMR